MNKNVFLSLALGALSLCCHLCFYICPYQAYAQDIKEPVVAGSFYPDNPAELSQMIDAFLAVATPEPVPGEILALIAPHAGYGFSGSIAALGYKLIQGKPYTTVVIIGPSHRYGFSGVSVWTGGAFRTPLGDAPVDTAFIQKLLNQDPNIVFDSAAFQAEHSVEVQVPFIQKAIPVAKIVPIVTGDCTLAVCEKMAAVLAGAIADRTDVLIVASTDMYHGYDYEEADIIDVLTLSYLKNMDALGLYYGLREQKLQLCGGFGAVIAMLTAKTLGHDKLFVLGHTNSSTVTGKKVKGSWTVGYTACVIDQDKACLPAGLPAGQVGSPAAEAGRKTDMLTKDQKKRLLGLARSSIETYLKTASKLEVTETDPVLKKEMGAFVTLHEYGQLRGCIGNMVAREPLYLAVRDMAVEAAVNDPRFQAVKLSDLRNLELEISVLSPLEKVDSAENIEMGKHGVLVRKGYASGVYLPQVATETGWSKEEFLSSLCEHKAGLSADAWKDPSTELYIFTAEVFSEKDL